MIVTDELSNNSCAKVVLFSKSANFFFDFLKKIFWSPLNSDKGLELERILQGCGFVEDEVVRSAVRVLVEVAYPLELHCDSALVFKQGWLGESLSEDEGLRIEVGLVVLSLRDVSHLRLSEELVVEPELNFLCVLGGHPVDGALDGPPPGFVVGSREHFNSMTLPSASLMTSSHLMM